MKLLKSLSAVALITMAGSAAASTISINPNGTTGTSAEATYDFDALGFNLDPISYYVDNASQDGYVNTGEFVFDFGTDVRIGSFITDGIGDIDNPNGYGTSWELTLDYLITGTAVVVNQTAVNAVTAFMVDQGIDDFNVAVQQMGAACAQFGFFCNTLADLQDTTYDDYANESLGANITDGLLNIFLSDGDGNREALAISYDVNGATILENGVNLSIFGEAIQILEDFWYTKDGDDFADLDQSPMGNLITEIFDAGLQSVPGYYYDDNAGDTLYTASGVNYSKEGTSTNVVDHDFKYATSDSYTVNQLVRDFNDCSSAPGGTSFGGCSGAIGEAEADAHWDYLKGTIRDAAGCTGGANSTNCDYDVLARTVNTDPTFRQYVPEPNMLFFGGIALLLAGFRMRKAS